MSETTALGKYMEVTKEVRIRGRVTDWWTVRNAQHGDRLGTIEWENHWRQYVFVPLCGRVFSADCLEEIRRFLIRMTTERKEGSP